jgi:hypothetical protein
LAFAQLFFLFYFIFLAEEGWGREDVAKWRSRSQLDLPLAISPGVVERSVGPFHDFPWRHERSPSSNKHDLSASNQDKR